LFFDERRGHTCLRLPVYDCPISRRRTAIERQQGEMHVDTTAAWRAQKLRRKNATIRDDYSNVSVVRRKQFLRFLSLDSLWLLHRQTMFECKLLDCGRVHFIATAGG